MHEPDWNLLPHHAVEFFRLENSFSRKDLKRAYGHLTKIYRPEQFPAEFQKIRAAYELLLHSNPTRRNVADDHELPFFQNREPESFRTSLPSDSNAESLERQSNEEYYDITRANTEFSLTQIISSPEQAINRICHLLRHNPKDHFLAQELYELCCQQEVIDVAESILTKLCEDLEFQLLSHVATRLWKHVIAEHTDIFHKLWAKHVSAHQHHYATDESYALLLSEVLPVAAWYADRKWLDDQFHFYRHCYELFWQFPNFNIDFVQEIYEFRYDYLDRGLAGNTEWDIKIFHRIRDYLTQDTPDATSRFLLLHQQFKEKSDELTYLAQIATGGDYRNTVRNIWDWACGIAIRNGDLDRPVSGHQVAMIIFETDRGLSKDAPSPQTLRQLFLQRKAATGIVKLMIGIPLIYAILNYFIDFLYG